MTERTQRLIMDSAYPSMTRANSFPTWKMDLWYPAVEDYNYRKPYFQQPPPMAATHGTILNQPGYSDVNNNSYIRDNSMVNLMDMYHMGGSDMLDISDMGMPEIIPGTGDLGSMGGMVPLRQPDIITSQTSFMQPVQQDQMAPMNQSYAFPSSGMAGMGADTLVGQLNELESDRNDMNLGMSSTDGNGRFPDFADIEGADSLSNVSSSMDDSCSLRSLLAPGSPADQFSHRNRSHSDGMLLRPKRTLTDRRHSIAGVESGTKKARCFWQYNLQAKGPKRDLRPKTMNLLRNPTNDPHVLKQPDDPVFDPVIALDAEWKGLCVQHTGKARRGNGNDLTADPKKLCLIGQELEELNAAISGVMGSSGGGATKQTARREKNKLTSRVCRLKKKAQHEANKIKLEGLHEQHKELMQTLEEVKAVMQRKVAAFRSGYPMADPMSAIDTAKAIENQTLRTFVSGRTVDYVNEQIEKTKERHFKNRPGLRSHL